MSTARTLTEIAADVFHHPGAKSIFAFFVYIFTYLFGSSDMFTSIAVPILLLLFLDAVTRFCLSIKDKEVNENILAKSAMKLFIYCSYIIMGRVVDHDIPGDYATMAFKGFIIGTECLGITATLGKLGVPLPPKLLKYFSAFTDDGTEIKK